MNSSLGRPRKKPAPGAPPPRVELTAILAVAGMLVSNYLPTPAGAENIIKLAIGIGLIGGIGVGHHYRCALNPLAFPKAIIVIVVLTIAILLIYLFVAFLQPGLFMTVVSIILAASLGASFGCLCALAGIKFGGD